MELVAITATLCVTFSLVLIPSAQHAYGLQSSALTLPRKLGLVEAAPPMKSDVGGKQLPSYEEHIGPLSVKHHPRGGGEGGAKAPGRRGTRQEWVEEGPDASLFFTMDYSKVRRRRPIHNKSIPVGP